jgi:hypothetical protein
MKESNNKLATAPEANGSVYLLTIAYYRIQWRIFQKEEIMRTTLTIEDELIDNAANKTASRRKHFL